MQRTLETSQCTKDIREVIHFPWAHVDDFRHFFGLDRLIEYSRKRTSLTAKCFARFLIFGATRKQMNGSLETVTAYTIAISHAIETSIEVKGQLAPQNNLDEVIRFKDPEFAASQRAQVLADHLHRNGILPQADMTKAMQTNRLAGLLAHHAADFWLGYHGDLFALVERLEYPMQIRFVLAALLRALPEHSFSAADAPRFIALFNDWTYEVERAIVERKRGLPDTPQAIAMRANLHELHAFVRAAA